MSQDNTEWQSGSHENNEPLQWCFKIIARLSPYIYIFLISTARFILFALLSSLRNLEKQNTKYI